MPTRETIYELTHKAQAMVLACIDYRFIDTAVHLVEGSELDNKFDFTTLAGASLGYNQRKYKCWRETFNELVELAIQLHDIHEIIVIDHMDCGAYAMIYPEIEKNSEQERDLHIKNINRFVRKARKQFPDLTYSGYLLQVDGSAERIL